MKTSADGVALIKYFESCRLKAYPDPKTGGAPWTCGWGETEGVTPDTWWTQSEADRRLAESIAAREKMVSKYVTHDMTQGQFDAFVSIFYNVGAGNQFKSGIARLKDGRPSTLLRCFNQGDIGGAETEWMKWISPGSNVEKGLATRRRCELALFRGEGWEQPK
jgi:lysozyme